MQCRASAFSQRTFLGQRVVRFYDLDKHIIEVGENMKIVCKRFLNGGMTPEQVAERMDVPIEFVIDCIK